MVFVSRISIMRFCKAGALHVRYKIEESIQRDKKTMTLYSHHHIQQKLRILTNFTELYFILKNLTYIVIVFIQYHFISKSKDSADIYFHTKIITNKSYRNYRKPFSISLYN